MFYFEWLVVNGSFGGGSRWCHSLRSTVQVHEHVPPAFKKRCGCVRRNSSIGVLDGDVSWQEYAFYFACIAVMEPPHVLVAFSGLTNDNDVVRLFAER